MEFGFEPPKFTEDNFNLWKCRMSIYLGASDYNFRDIIKNGPHVPNKPESQWSEEDKKLVQLDLKVMYIIMMSLLNNVFESVMFCDTAKDMWDTLCEIYEGTEDVKEIKKVNLNRQYELFVAKKGESLTDTFNRFTRLLNDLRAVGVKKENIARLNKFMDALPDHWDNLIMCLKMTDRLKKMSLPALYGTFLYQEELKAQNKTARKSKAQINQVRGKKTSFKTYDSETSSSSDEEDDVANMCLSAKLRN